MTRRLKISGEWRGKKIVESTRITLSSHEAITVERHSSDLWFDSVMGLFYDEVTPVSAASRLVALSKKRQQNLKMTTDGFEIIVSPSADEEDVICSLKTVMSLLDEVVCEEFAVYDRTPRHCVRCGGVGGVDDLCVNAEEYSDGSESPCGCCAECRSKCVI